MQEFTIPGYAYTFRVRKIRPTTLLAVSTQLDFEDYKHLETCFDFALENIDVKIGEEWLRVKEPGRDIYMPAEIENDIQFMKKVVTWFITNVIKKVFQNSTE